MITNKEKTIDSTGDGSRVIASGSLASCHKRFEKPILLDWNMIVVVETEYPGAVVRLP